MFELVTINAIGRIDHRSEISPQNIWHVMQDLIKAMDPRSFVTLVIAPAGSPAHNLERVSHLTYGGQFDAMRHRPSASFATELPPSADIEAMPIAESWSVQIPGELRLPEVTANPEPEPEGRTWRDRPPLL